MTRVITRDDQSPTRPAFSFVDARPYLEGRGRGHGALRGPGDGRHRAARGVQTRAVAGGVVARRRGRRSRSRQSRRRVADGPRRRLGRAGSVSHVWGSCDVEPMGESAERCIERSHVKAICNILGEVSDEPIVRDCAGVSDGRGCQFRHPTPGIDTVTVHSTCCDSTCCPYGSVCSTVSGKCIPIPEPATYSRHTPSQKVPTADAVCVSGVRKAGIDIPGVCTKSCGTEPIDDGGLGLSDCDHTCKALEDSGMYVLDCVPGGGEGDECRCSPVVGEEVDECELFPPQGQGFKCCRCMSASPVQPSTP